MVFEFIPQFWLGLAVSLIGGLVLMTMKSKKSEIAVQGVEEGRTPRNIIAPKAWEGRKKFLRSVMTEGMAHLFVEGIKESIPLPIKGNDVPITMFRPANNLKEFLDGGSQDWVVELEYDEILGRPMPKGFGKALEEKTAEFIRRIRNIDAQAKAEKTTEEIREEEQTDLEAKLKAVKEIVPHKTSPQAG